MVVPYRFIKRKDRKFIQVSFAHIPGRWFSTKTDDMQQAILWAQAKLKQDIPSVDGKTTLAEFATGFFDKEDPLGFRHRQERRGYNHDDMYYERKAGYLRNYILPAHGGYLINAITDVLIEDFILDLDSVMYKRPLSGDTKNKVLEAYSNIMKEAKRKGLISDNPCDGVDKVVCKDKETMPFTDQELAKLFPSDDDKLLRIWGGLYWATYFRVLKDTGWRPGEVSALSKPNFFPNLWGPNLHGVFTQESVHWKTRRVVSRIKTSDTDNGAKNKKGYIVNQTARLLVLLGARKKGKYYFEKDDGKFPTLAAQNKRLEAACSKAGVLLKDRRQYSFRHSWCTEYIGKMPEEARLVLLGHVENRPEYTHLEPVQALKRVLENENVRKLLEERS